MEREIAHIILKHVGSPTMSSSEREALVETLAGSLPEIINERLGQPLYPKAGESLALSVMKPKTAALAFNKVYRIPFLSDPVPEEIGFYCATAPEIAVLLGVIVRVSAKEVGLDLDSAHSAEYNSAEGEAHKLRLLSSQFSKDLNIIPTIFYHSRGPYRRDFPFGKREILTAAISNIAMVDERKLTWEQVIDFRQDAETRNKYRRFVRWVDAELKSKSMDEMQDLIAIRLDDYEWALKKHGVKVAMGTLSCLIDPKFLGAASATVAAAAVAGGSIWAGVAGASLAIGQAIASFGSSYIDSLDERRSENYEVAYIHEIKKELS